MIKIEYWNSYDILGVHYEGDYKNSFWLNIEVKKPEYIVTREATENSESELINQFLKWEKQYKFDLFCREPLADAISTITLHDNVYVTFDNGYYAKCKDFLSEITWTEIDAVAKITVSFITKSYTVNGSAAAKCD
jgi:hypothetical protein